VKSGTYNRILTHYVGLEDDPEQEVMQTDEQDERFIDFEGFRGYESWELADNLLVDDTITVLNRDGLSIMGKKMDY